MKRIGPYTIRPRGVSFLLLTGVSTALTGVPRAAGRADNELEKKFARPPVSDRAWVYWWWLNGAASKEGITRDFEEMKRQGIAGALLFDAGEGGPEVPRGPRFMGPEWPRTFQACGAGGRTLRHRAERQPLQRMGLRRPVGNARSTLPKSWS